jgi:hypothetical protein
MLGDRTLLAVGGVAAVAWLLLAACGKCVLRECQQVVGEEGRMRMRLERQQDSSCLSNEFRKHRVQLIALRDQARHDLTTRPTSSGGLRSSGAWRGAGPVP